MSNISVTFCSTASSVYRSQLRRPPRPGHLGTNISMDGPAARRVLVLQFYANTFLYTKKLHRPIYSAVTYFIFP